MYQAVLAINEEMRISSANDNFYAEIDRVIRVGL